VNGTEDAQRFCVADGAEVRRSRRADLGDGIADHVAMFDDWTGEPGTTFCTIEGNITTAGEPNGGRIAQLERRADQRVMAFVHVRG